MKPEVGNHVKCLLRNGTFIEGIVDVWKEMVIDGCNDVQLQSLSDNSIIIIPHPADDIMLIKIMIKDAVKNNISIKNDLEQEFEEVHEKSNPFDDLSNKKLAELKIELIKQDKEILAKKLREHHLGEVKKVKYGQPGFFKKQGS